MQAKLVLGGNFPIVLTWFIQLGQLKFLGPLLVHVKKMKKISQLCCSTLRNDNTNIQQNRERIKH